MVKLSKNKKMGINNEKYYLYSGKMTVQEQWQSSGRRKITGCLLGIWA
jgi:hypothetical protein